MFTGIVQTKAKIIGLNDQHNFRQLKVSVGAQFIEKLIRGASIAINGVCLTVTSFSDDGIIDFDIIDETLAKTNLGALEVGEWVNFERSLYYGSEIGGHILSGHIHATAILTTLERNAVNCNMRLTLSPEWMPYVLKKGFIAVEGCSLTVGETFADGFMLHLIPETLDITTLNQKKAGDLLNIELDQQTLTIVQTVERIMRERYR